MPAIVRPEFGSSETSVLASVRESGQEHQQTIVLIHGSMDRQAAFSRMSRVLRQSYHVLSYDRRGYAKSSKVVGPFTMQEQIADLLEVLQYGALGRSVVLVGHSFGGAVALACLQNHAHLIAGVVVFESPMSWQPWWPASTGGSAAVATSDDPPQAAENFMKRFIGKKRWEELPEGTRALRRAEGPALVGELSDIRRAAPWHIEKLGGPIMAGYGQLSKPHLRESAMLIGSRPDCRAVELEAAHHNAHSGQPEQFVERLIEPVIRRVRQGSWS